MAAGLTVLPEKIDDLRAALDRYADLHLKAEDYIPRLELEADLPPNEITVDLVEDLAKLEPYGMANPKPLFGSFDVRGFDAKTIGREGQHLKFSLRGGVDSLEAIGWKSYLPSDESQARKYVDAINLLENVREEEWKTAAEQEEAARKTLEEMGMVVYYPTSEEMKLWYDTAEKVYDEFREILGDELVDKAIAFRNSYSN